MIRMRKKNTDMKGKKTYDISTIKVFFRMIICFFLNDYGVLEV